jgi:hypothetical protein
VFREQKLQQAHFYSLYIYIYIYIFPTYREQKQF